MTDLFVMDDSDMCLIEASDLKNLYMRGWEDGYNDDIDSDVSINLSVVGKHCKCENKKLSPQQLRCLIFISDFESEHGYMPTKTEIGEELDVTRERARVIVAKLADKGYIYQTAYERRDMYITEAGREVIGWSKSES